MKKMNRRSFLRVGAAVVLVCTALPLTGCKKNVEKLVVGDWYPEGGDWLYFTAYDDGTVDISGDYGTGKWSIANGDKLRLTSLYGETFVYKIEDIDKKKMVVREVRKGKESEDTLTLYHTAEEAVKH